MKRWLPRRTVLRRFELSAEALDRLEELELVVPVRRPGRERHYSLEDVDRVRVFCLLQRELEVNQAGAEIILRLRQQLIEMRRGLARLLEALRDDDELARLRDLLDRLGGEPWD